MAKDPDMTDSSYPAATNSPLLPEDSDATPMPEMLEGSASISASAVGNATQLGSTLAEGISVIHLDSGDDSEADKYHPDHNDKSHDVVLESSDGVRFRVSAERLGYKSEFFKNVLELPVPSETKDKVIPLLYTGSEALLVMVQYIMKKQMTLPQPISSATTSKFCEDIIAAADAYDLPRLNKAIFKHLLKDNKFPPVTFLFAAADHRSDLARYTFKLLPYSGQFASDAWWAKLLHAKAPLEYSQLHAVYLKWNDAASNFDSSRRSQSNQFGQRCRSIIPEGSKKPVNFSSTTPDVALCPVFQCFDGDFTSFRLSVDPPFDVLMKYAKDLRNHTDYDMLNGLGVPRFDCPVCMNRLARDLKSAAKAVRRRWTPDTYVPLWPSELR